MGARPFRLKAFVGIALGTLGQRARAQRFSSSGLGARDRLTPSRAAFGAANG